MIIALNPFRVFNNNANGSSSESVNQSAPNITVATFTGADPSIAGAGNYTAMITWGDGNQSAGTVSYTNGVYSVQGAHAYATA